MNTKFRWMFRYGPMIALAAFLTGCRGSGQSTQAQGSLPQPVVERVLGGLHAPVSLVFLSPRVWLVAEQHHGQIRWIEDGKLRATPFAAVDVSTAGDDPDHGLLSLAVDPNYPTPSYVYACHTAGGGGRITRFTIRNGKGLEPVVIVDNLPAAGRIAFGADGQLYVAQDDLTADARAQDYAALAGKVLRFTPGGGIPADNPLELETTGWAGKGGDDNKPVGGMKTPVFTIGHRDPRGIAVQPDTGDVYITEVGPNHGDEINRLVAGDNYGWPEVVGAAENPRFRVPLWTTGVRELAPTGAAFYTGATPRAFRGNLFFTSLRDGKLRRAIFKGRDTISAVVTVPEAGNHAKLDVAIGLDGNIYFTDTDAIYRLRLK